MSNMIDTTAMHTVNTKVLRDNDDTKFTIQQTQYIPKDFLDSLRRQRESSLDFREKDYMSVCKVPVAVHQKWMREGFNMMEEPAHAIVARLKQENLDAFLTTKKQV